jgi:hypothetical protein
MLLCDECQKPLTFVPYSVANGSYIFCGEDCYDVFLTRHLVHAGLGQCPVCDMIALHDPHIYEAYTHMLAVLAWVKVCVEKRN